MNYTTIEQSKKLVDLGLNTETADMYYPWDFENAKLCEIPIAKNLGFLECWSLESLIEISKVCTRLESHLTINKKWNIFATCKDNVFNPFYTTHPEGYNSQLEAYYDLVCWLLENNYIDKII